MLGKITVIQEDKRAVFIQLEEPTNLKIGTEVTVSKKKKIRSVPQNNFYWQLLTWVIRPNGGGLCRQGRLSIDGLHYDIKIYMEENHKHDFPQAFDEKGRFTTTKLTRYEFEIFFDFVNLEIMIEFYGLDMSPFWKSYEKFRKWSKYNQGDFNDYINEAVPF